MDILAQIAVQVVGDTSPLDAAMNQAITTGQSYGNRVGSAFALGFSNPLLNAVGGVNSLVGGLRMVLDTFTDISGVRVAAQFGDFRRQLLGIAGDANTANSAFEKFVALANSTNFDVPDALRFGLRQAGRTGDVAGAVGKTENILNAAAAFGVRPQDFNRFQENLGQIENRGSAKTGVVDLRQFLNVAPIATKAIADAMGTSVAEASNRLRGSTGTEFTRMIQMVGDRNRGLAQTQASSDPLKVAANIADSARTGIEPTGRLLNRILTPAAMGVKALTDNLGELNQATGGGAGVVAIIGGGIFVMRQYGTSTMTALAATRSLTGSLVQMAGAAEAAAIASRTNAGANIGGTVAGAAGAAGAVTGLGRAFGFLGRIVNFVKSSLGIALIGTALSVGLGYAGSSLNKPGASVGMRGLGAALGGAGTGLGIGVGVGSFFGPPGMLVGGLIGTIIGAAGGMIAEKVKQNREAAGGSPEAAKNAEALKANTDALKTASRALGGGQRVNTSLSIVEREWSVYQLMRGNAVGVG